jgi:hypothetical protein
MAAAHSAGFGCNGTVDWRLGEQPYYPPLVNDDGAADFAWDVAARLLGAEKVGAALVGGSGRLGTPACGGSRFDDLAVARAPAASCACLAPSQRGCVQEPT